MQTKPNGRMEEMTPDELEKVLQQAPVAFVPLGTFEHHGWHLPVCFDGIKAHALWERVAKRTGGTVLPTFFYGTGGGHAAKYETSIAMALNPYWVHLNQLTAGHDPAKTTLPTTPRKDVPTHDPTQPLYAIHGQDPRTAASTELGAKLAGEIVSRLSRLVEEALDGAGGAVE